MRETRTRTQRLIAGALLGSSLTQKELINISERLLHDKKWREQLAIYLRNIVDVTYLSRTKRDMYNETELYEMPEEFAAEIVEMFSSKRVPKIEALKILSKLSKSKSWSPNPKRSVRENSTELIMSLRNEDEARLLLKYLADYLGYEGDPYLRGLL